VPRDKAASEHAMPQDARFALVANIRHFTSVLQNIDLPAGQQMAIRLLLADSQRRLAKLGRVVN
jgi:hypothetical protein